MYPNSEDVQFDAEYYKNKHLPMVSKLVGSALKGMEFNLGIGTRVPAKPAPYVAIAHLKFDSMASFQESFGPHSDVLAADVKNYSNVDGELQISEIITL